MTSSKRPFDKTTPILRVVNKNNNLNPQYFSKQKAKHPFLLTIAVLDIYTFPPPVLHKYSFLRIKTPSFFHEKVRFLNILFISSILPCIKKSVRVRSVCDPFAQFRMPVTFITIRLIRARIIFLEQSYSFNSFEIYFLKHQDSFNSLNSCSKK